ncbi:MAG: hypothetical protein R2837_00155 [Aliarcobacter sp.]
MGILYMQEVKWHYQVCKSISDVAPISSEQNITINPNFVLDCK